jgi:hypothetical protein
MTGRTSQGESARGGLDPHASERVSCAATRTIGQVAGGHADDV